MRPVYLFGTLLLAAILASSPQGSQGSSFIERMKQQYLEKLVTNLKAISQRQSCLTPEAEAVTCIGSRGMEIMKEVSIPTHVRKFRIS